MAKSRRIAFHAFVPAASVGRGRTHTSRSAHPTPPHTQARVSAEVNRTAALKDRAATELADTEVGVDSKSHALASSSLHCRLLHYHLPHAHSVKHISVLIASASHPRTHCSSLGECVRHRTSCRTCKPSLPSGWSAQRLRSDAWMPRGCVGVLLLLCANVCVCSSCGCRKHIACTDTSHTHRKREQPW